MIRLADELTMFQVQLILDVVDGELVPDGENFILKVRKHQAGGWSVITDNNGGWEIVPRSK